MNNSELDAVVHSIDEWRLMDDEEKVEEKFQRGMEKFQRDWEGTLIGLLCSRNAQSRTPLVGRAQWETNSGHPRGEDTSALGRTIGDIGHSGNAAPPPRHALYTALHRGRFGRAPGERVRTRRGCLRSRGWRGAAP